FLSPGEIFTYIPPFSAIFIFAFILIIVTLMRQIFRDVTANALLLFAFAAIVHHFIWMTYWRYSGNAFVHYPFDYILAIGSFSIIWLKGYMKMHRETRELAEELQ